MIERESFWAHVHGALDARRDPLEVPEVQRALAEEPELLDELAALSSGLELLGRSKQRRARSFAAAAVLIVCVASIAAWRGARTTSSDSGSADPTIVSAAAPAQVAEVVSLRPLANTAGSRVIAFRAEVTLDGPHGRWTRSTDASGSVLASASNPSDRSAPIAVQTFVALMNPASQPR